MPRDYYFIRHGSPEVNRDQINVATFEKAMLGQMDPPLSGHGRKEALALAPAVKALGVERLVSSTLKRAAETAQIISTETNIPFTGQYEQVREFIPGSHAPGESHILKFLSWPHWPRMSKNIFAPKFYRLLVIYYLVQWRRGKTRGGDSLERIRERVLWTLETLDSMPEKKIGIATHGYWIFFLTFTITGGGLENFPRFTWVDTCSVTHVRSHGNGQYELSYFAKNLTDERSKF